MTRSFWHAMPKAELHCHLEGAVPAATFVELARKNGVSLATYDPEAVYDVGDTLESFLEVYTQVCASIVTADDFSLVTYSALRDGAEKGNLRYREMFFNPTNHGDISYKDAIDGVIDGIKAAEADHGVVCRIIPAINREQPPARALALVEDMIEHRRDEVVGVGIDHNELAGAPPLFADAFARAGAAGLRRTAHAGERTSSSEIAESIDLLGCERIDHGYAVLNDPQLLERSRSMGIHFAGCWTVSVFHHGDDPATTPIGRMIDAGLHLSINSDDPPMMATDIGEEFARAAATLGLTEDDAVSLTFAALDAAWLPDDERGRLRRSFEQEIGRLKEQHGADRAP